MKATSERSFSFLRTNEREDKPRTRGLTEIRARRHLGNQEFVGQGDDGTRNDERQITVGRFCETPRRLAQTPYKFVIRILSFVICD